MKYVVEVGYMKFGYFESSTTAVSWAEIAKKHCLDGKEVTVKVLNDEEAEDDK